MTIYIQKFLLVLLLATACFSCRRTFEPGIETTVTGIVYDYNQQKTKSGVMIRISEVRKEGLFPSRIAYSKILDSTLSGADGKYELTFKTTGRGNIYDVFIDPPGNFYPVARSQRLQIGSPNKIDFNGIELHVLKAALHMVNNPKPPLRAFGVYGSFADVYGVNADTTVILKIIPNKENVIQFQITNPDSSQYYNRRFDTIKFTGFADTFSMDFQLDPRTFPRR